jgi:hypothetical protein
MNRKILGMLLGIALAGCSAGESGWAGSVEPLAGGGELVRNPRHGLWTEGEAWRLEPALRIGRMDGAGPEVFGRVSALEVRDGRIYVLEGQAREVRVFDATGAHVHTFGGSGSGPGEFGSPTGLAFDPSGTLWVPDGANARYARHDTSGALLEYRARSSIAVFFGGFRGGIDERGRLFDVDLVLADGGAGLNPMMAAAGLGGGGREILRAMFAVDGGEVTDTVWIPEAVPAPEPFTVSSGRGRMMLGVPFARRMHFTFDPRGHVWFGDSGEYRIVQQSLSGDTIRIIEREYTPLRVTGEEVDAWLEEQERFQEAGGRIDRSRIPSTKPVFDGLVIGEEGELWVRLVTDSDDTTFDVYDPGGRFRGSVIAGPGLASSPLPIVREGALWAVTRDELDVPYITRMRIVKP